MAQTARAAFTKSSPVPVWLQYFEKRSKIQDSGFKMKKTTGGNAIKQALYHGIQRVKKFEI